MSVATITAAGCWHKPDKRRQRVAELYTNGCSERAVARLLGVSRITVRRDIQLLNRQ